MTSPREGAINRRGLLTLAAVSALSAACAQTTRGGGGSAQVVDKAKQLLPAHIPFQGVKPDIQPPASLGFTKYPQTLVKAIPEVPGKGSTFTALIPLWGPPPTTTTARSTRRSAQG